MRLVVTGFSPKKANKKWPPANTCLLVSKYEIDKLTLALMNLGTLHRIGKVYEQEIDPLNVLKIAVEMLSPFGGTSSLAPATNAQMNQIIKRPKH